MNAKNRDLRLYEDRGDQRTQAQRDRDRILYCSAFRRLAEVTQVVSADEGHVFHNRLTHSLKVAQIARRLAEKLGKEQNQIADELGGLDPDVAEAAALAHDLGHPPFGHVVEVTLNALADQEGFEGNAQSFRIVTRLAIRTDKYAGLNLTAATLNGVLKYPWLRSLTSGHKKNRKWGAYHSDEEQFSWARQTFSLPADMKSVEAELMDWADDIAYSIFDVEDFFRAGLIPLPQVLSGTPEQERFIEGAKRRLKADGADEEKITAYTNALAGLPFPARRLYGRYQGTQEQRAALRSWTSWAVSRYVGAIELKIPNSPADSTVTIIPERKAEVEILKQLVWHYVIDNPALVTQQHGQRTAIHRLFELFADKAGHNKATHDFGIFPIAFRAILEQAERDGSLENTCIRTVIDMLASFTERQTMRMYQRLFGMSLGSVLDVM
jgi:dGTPase